ncbi:MAG: hypothetical protein Q8K28_14990 [Hoeflea sp.]|uniref:hypothetical protein n=1 Tax=Hoeflea sp. TaxID=1940281 RepID=UPI0027318CFB|nr:hypothetical protein [Hoeflea sp.]MDP2121202.1 hypothetical protein [Hoeflea sp.]
MMTFRIFGHEFGIEFWSNPLRIQDWQLGQERLGDAFQTRLYWFGPAHVAVCKPA